MPPEDRTAWKRVGHLLAERRSQISPRYANRRAFAADREMNWRTLHDIELAKRDNFKPETMRAFEAAYLLIPGSLDRALAGGDLEPLPAAPSSFPLRPVPAVPPGSPAEEILASLLDRYLDDPVVQAIGAQRKRPRMVVEEILEWLDIQEERAGRRGSGTSAG